MEVFLLLLVFSLSLPGPKLPLPVKFPEAHSFICTPQEGVMAIRRKTDGGYSASMSLVAPQFLAAGHLPQPQGFIRTAREGVFAVRLEKGE
jgi:hypothetical protein